MNTALPARNKLKIMTVEEFLNFLGYELRSGKWAKIDNEGAMLCGTDILKAFCPGGLLSAPMGHEVVAPANEAATFELLWDLKGLPRDYHPDGPNFSHASYGSCYRALQNEKGFMHLLTIPELDSWGSDQDALTPAALNTGITVAKIREGLIATSPNDPAGQVLAVWLGAEHAGQKNGDSDFVDDLDLSLWDFVHPKGYKYPWEEEYGCFYSVRGPVHGDNGFDRAIQSHRKLKKRKVSRISRFVNLGLVTKYCIWNTSHQARELGYEVVNAIDGIRPFDPGEEADTFSAMEVDGQRFVTNEVMAEANAILASQA